MLCRVRLFVTTIVSETIYFSLHEVVTRIKTTISSKVNLTGWLICQIEEKKGRGVYSEINTQTNIDTQKTDNNNKINKTE